MPHRITLIRVRRDANPDINRELQWLGNSLGLFTMRDKDSSCFRVFITLVRKARRNEIISSDAIAERLQLSRGTVVHHLNRLMESGLVIRESGGYILRESNLTKLVQDVRKDIQAMVHEMAEVAKEIDEKLGS